MQSIKLNLNLKVVFCLSIKQPKNKIVNSLELDSASSSTSVDSKAASVIHLIHSNLGQFTKLMESIESKPLKKNKVTVNLIIKSKKKIIDTYNYCLKLKSMSSKYADYCPIRSGLSLPLVDSLNNQESSSFVKVYASRYLSNKSSVMRVQYALFIISCAESYVAWMDKRLWGNAKQSVPVQASSSKKKAKSDNRGKTQLNNQILCDVISPSVKPRLEKIPFVDLFFIVEGVSDMNKLNSVAKNIFSLPTHGSGVSNTLKSVIKLLLNEGKRGFILTDPDSAGKELQHALLSFDRRLIALNIPASIASKKTGGKRKAGVEHCLTSDLSNFLCSKLEYWLSIKQEGNKMVTSATLERKLTQQEKDIRRSKLISTRKKAIRMAVNDLEPAYKDLMVEVKQTIASVKNTDLTKELWSELGVVKTKTTALKRYNERNFELTGKYLAPEREVIGFYRNAPRLKKGVNLLPSFYKTKFFSMISAIESSNCPYKINTLLVKARYNLAILLKLQSLELVSDVEFKEEMVADTSYVTVN